jgi:hypothetical protein
MNYTNEITNELVAEFGSSILSKNNPIPANALTLRQCQILLNKYGFEKAQVIAKRWASLHKVGK